MHYLGQCFINFFNISLKNATRKGRLMLVLLVFFGLLGLLCVGCIGGSWWAAYDIQKNLDLARKEGYAYFVSENEFKSTLNVLESKLNNKLKKEIFDNWNNYYEKNKNNPAALNKFSMDFTLDFSQDEFLAVVYNVCSKSNDKNKEKLLKLIKDKLLMIRFIDNELHVVLPVTKVIYSDLNSNSLNNLDSIINSSSVLIESSDKGNYLVNASDLFVRFVYKTDGLKFKVNRFDFNDSFLVKLLLESSINNLIKNNQDNFVYQSFFEFENMDYLANDKFMFKRVDMTIDQGKLNIRFNLSAKN